MLSSVLNFGLQYLFKMPAVIDFGHLQAINTALKNRTAQIVKDKIQSLQKFWNGKTNSSVFAVHRKIWV